MVTVDDYRLLDLTHLHPVSRELARLLSAERLHRIRADRWIGYPKAVDAVERLEMLFRWPRKQRMPNLLLIGPTNNGKSMVVERFRPSAAPARDGGRPRKHSSRVHADALGTICA